VGCVPVPKSDNQTIRPVVLVSEHTLRRFPVLLGQLTLGLTEKSIPTTLVCAPGIKLDSLLRGPVEVIRYPACDLPLAERMGRGRLLEQLAKSNPNVLHCLCETKAAQARALARSLDIPYVLNINSLQRDASKISLSSKRCVHIICPTHTIAESVRVMHPGLADRIIQVRPGVFVEDQCCCFQDPLQQACLMMAHPFEHAALFTPVFAAIRDLISTGYEFCVVLMGDGPAESPIRQMLMEMDLTQVVTIVPELDPWRSVLAAGDVFIQPQAVPPGLNFFLLEAMAVGAAVAACQGCVDDMIIDGQTALVFDPQDHLSIRAVLRGLLDHHELARELAQGGQAYLRSSHSTSDMIENVVQAYSAALQWSYGLTAIG
jgi:glycosyltransferase involved in cell wall biosynthesis